MLTQEIRVSVAMVTFNGERYIREQITSVMRQLQAQDELVISDDGSADHTVDIIKEYQKKDARIRLFRGPGQGIKKKCGTCPPLYQRQVYFSGGPG